MSPIIFYDTETTGFPDWKSPSDAEHQPHLVQLAAILCNAETREVIETMYVIIKPESWVIDPENAAIHGTTQEIALAKGIPETEALELFLNMCNILPLPEIKPAIRVAHNRTFDQRIIRIQMKRYGYSEAELEAWADKENHFCTMWESKPIIKIPAKGKAFKLPTLGEAYKHFTGKDLENAHTAMADARACMEIYWAMKDLEQEAA